MHEELLHVHFDLQLSLVLHLRQIENPVMADHLVLVMSIREEEVRMMLTEGGILNLKSNENTREPYRHCEA